MENLGLFVRKLRESQGLPLREVSLALDIDQAIISKLERMQRQATLEQVQKLAAYYRVPIDELMTHWLSDKIAKHLSGQELAMEALDMARTKVRKQAEESYNRESVFQQVYIFFLKTNYNRVWVYGDFAGGQSVHCRTLNVLVEPPAQKLPTTNQLQSLKVKLERVSRLKINLVLKDPLAPIDAGICDHNLTLILEKTC